MRARMEIAGKSDWLGAYPTFSEHFINQKIEQINEFMKQQEKHFWENSPVNREPAYFTFLKPTDTELTRVK